VDEPRTPWELRFEIPTVAHRGDPVATANGAVFERGGFRLGPVDLDIARAERVAVVGANGSGPTILLVLRSVRIDRTLCLESAVVTEHSAQGAGSQGAVDDDAPS
jgi:ATPase subunit of ABC transporter with duplicated ATPase domains